MSTTTIADAIGDCSHDDVLAIREEIALQSPDRLATVTTTDPDDAPLAIIDERGRPMTAAAALAEIDRYLEAQQVTRGRAVKPDYIVLGDELDPSPETTPEDTKRFIAAVERITGVPVKIVGEIATTGGSLSGPVVLRRGIYHSLPSRDDAYYIDEDYADLPDDWYERAWEDATR